MVTAPHASHPPRPPEQPTDPEVARIAPGTAEAVALLPWLDRGLRGGRSGRLRAELPTALADSHAGRHFVVRRQGGPAAHAFGRLLPVRAGHHRLCVGTVGLVYTDPLHRRQGLASRCVTAATAWLAGNGAGAAILWSDRERFYARLGYHRAGREILLGLDPAVMALARITLGGLDPTAAAGPGDFPELEALYAAHPWRAERAPGELAELAAAPDCTLLVARRAGRPVAYAAAGRGDDLQGVVHEWAGDVRGVASCLDELVHRLGPLHLMAGPEPSELLRLLRTCGAESHAGALGLLRALRPRELLEPVFAREPALRGIAIGEAGDGVLLRWKERSLLLDAREGAALLFGPALPDRLHAELAPELCAVLARALPLPLFLWGFDSI